MRKKFTDDELTIIMESTHDRCHICRKKLCFGNYGSMGSKGCWEVDHSKALANGGTNYLRNLRPACVSCNRSKGKKPSRSARKMHGYTSAPMSKAKIDKEKSGNSWAGGFIGGILGLPFGPGGVIVGASLGAAVGNSIDVE